MEIFKRLRPVVFWPPFLLLLAALAWSLNDPEGFLTNVRWVKDQIIHYTGWLFTWGTLLMVVACAILVFSPLGKQKIGGSQARPLFSRWRWFSITLCTTVATGILFWGTAEPLFHLQAQPATLDVEAESAEAARFSLSTMFMHWSFTPYAIYTIPALMFALAYYNRQRSFSLGAALFPLQKKEHRLSGGIIDSICLYALVAGMAASLGAGILSLSGGITQLSGWNPGHWGTALLCLLVVASFCFSAISGIHRGIRILSVLNIRIFILLCAYLMIVGPGWPLLQDAFSALGDYFSNFLSRSTYTGSAEDTWPGDWTIFYWANWLAWAPVTALFLGRIAYGYTVREFVLFNWVFPALFSILWMSVFSGTAIHMETTGQMDLSGEGKSIVAETVIYHMFDLLPYGQVVAMVFLLTLFLSYVTAADSNTEAMSGLSAEGISPTSPNPPVGIKILWGAIIGLVSWVMIRYAGVDGIKMLSTLGGLPALFLILAITVGFFKVLWRPSLAQSQIDKDLGET